MLLVGFSGFYCVHYLQALLGVDSFNCLLWNDGPATLNASRINDLPPHLSRLKVSPSEMCHGASPPTLLGEMRVEGQGQEQEGKGLGGGPRHSLRALTKQPHSPCCKRPHSRPGTTKNHTERLTHSLNGI